MKEITSEHVDLLLENERIIFAVLTRCQIYPHHHYYEDYLQLGRIHFLTTLANYNKPYKTLSDWHSFVGYISQRLYWRFIDELRRKPATKYDIITLNSDYLAHQVDPEGETFIENLVVQEHIDQLLSQLRPMEQHLLLALFHQGITVNAYAKQYSIPRATAYKRREKIARLYRKLLRTAKEAD